MALWNSHASSTPVRRSRVVGISKYLFHGQPSSKGLVLICFRRQLESRTSSELPLRFAHHCFVVERKNKHLQEPLRMTLLCNCLIKTLMSDPNTLTLLSPPLQAQTLANIGTACVGLCGLGVLIYLPASGQPREAPSPHMYARIANRALEMEHHLACPALLHVRKSWSALMSYRHQ